MQVPQWDVDWSKYAVDGPDTKCHWYVATPVNTLGMDLMGKTLLGLFIMDSKMPQRLKKNL